MKKYIFIFSLILTLSFSKPHTVKAIFCSNCSNIFTQIYELSQGTISAGANVVTSAQTTLNTINNNFLIPARDTLTLISMVKSSEMMQNMILGSVGVDPLLVRKPEQYLKNEGKKILRGVVEDPEIQQTIYDVSIMRSLIGKTRFEAKNLNDKIKSINVSDVATLAQENYCTEEALSAQAKKDVAASGNTSEEAYNARKRALNQALCVGDAKSDPQTKANLLEMNRENPTWDTFLAITGGDNGWTKQQSIDYVINKRQEEKKSEKKNDLDQGGGIKSDVECSEYVVPGNKETGCKEGKERTKKTSSILSDSFGDALSNPLKAQLAGFGKGAGSLLGTVASMAGTAFTTMGLLENLSGNFGGGSPEEGDDTFGEGGDVRTTTTVSYRNDLATNPELRTSVTKTPMEQLANHRLSLQKLILTDDTFIQTLNNERRELDSLEACYRSLINTEPDIVDDYRVQNALGFSANKRSENSELLNRVSQEKTKANEGIELLSTVESKFQTSQSSEEILDEFLAYQDTLQQKNIPNITAEIERSGEHIIFKQSLDTSIRENGDIWNHNNVCSQIRQEQLSRSGGIWNRGGGGDGGI